jgi:hypothetical protein
MELSRLIFISQSVFGAVITCLAVYTFININALVTLSTQSQLTMLWMLVSLCLLVYGLLQLSQGLVEMLEVIKTNKENK